MSIMAAFTKAMEIIIRASKWVVGGERRQHGKQLQPVGVCIDDLTLVTTTVPWTKTVLERINMNLRWATMKIKLSKSWSILICRGQISDPKFIIHEDLSDKEHVDQFRKDLTTSRPKEGRRPGQAAVLLQMSKRNAKVSTRDLFQHAGCLRQGRC